MSFHQTAQGRLGFHRTSKTRPRTPWTQNPIQPETRNPAQLLLVLDISITVYMSVTSHSEIGSSPLLSLSGVILFVFTYESLVRTISKPETRNPLPALTGVIDSFFTYSLTREPIVRPKPQTSKPHTPNPNPKNETREPLNRLAGADFRISMGFTQREPVAGHDGRVGGIRLTCRISHHPQD